MQDYEIRLEGGKRVSDGWEDRRPPVDLPLGNRGELAVFLLPACFFWRSSAVLRRNESSHLGGRSFEVSARTDSHRTGPVSLGPGKRLEFCSEAAPICSRYSDVGVPGGSRGGCRDVSQAGEATANLSQKGR